MTARLGPVFIDGRRQSVCRLVIPTPGIDTASKHIQMIHLTTENVPTCNRNIPKCKQCC